MDEPKQCGSTFAQFGLGSELADLYICDQPRGHVSTHMDRVARKAWNPFRTRCDDNEETRE